ncbi:MAG: efflux RND transporter periplasmic adaptor subunit [Gammaproteobacteria bacterium]|nr:efflux RND transporter periplasmic adaptor subunit [Gammaproteobacteria bacterium]
MKSIIPYICTIILFISPPLLALESTELDCLVRPEMYIELSSPVDSTLKEVLVKSGDIIKINQPLALLESSVEKAKVKLAKMQAGSFSDIENRKVQLKYANRNNTRHQALYAKKSISLFEKDKAETEVALARIELSKARENKQIAQLSLEQKQAELALRTIKSPIDGIVVDTYARVGEFTAERTIMKLAQIDPLRVELIVPTKYFGKIKPGMKVNVIPEHPVNMTYRATVTVVDQLIDSASGSFTVRLAIPNPDDKLVAGVNCIARFNL